MDELKTLAQRLREKTSRDNRALLDEAADTIDRLTEDKSCAWCRGEEKVVDDKNTQAMILKFPTPHILVKTHDRAFGIVVNYCPLCGRCFDEGAREW